MSARLVRLKEWNNVAARNVLCRLNVWKVVVIRGDCSTN